MFRIILAVMLIFTSVFSSALWAKASCKLTNIVASTPLTRFNLNGDATVTDLKTGLMWKQCPEGKSGSDCLTGNYQNAFWDTSLNEIVKLNAGAGFAGYKDWRMPNVKELRSIIEAQCYGPAVNEEVFPNTPLVNFLTSSLVNDTDRNRIWAIEFRFGRVERMNITTSAYVRLVRTAK